MKRKSFIPSRLHAVVGGPVAAVLAVGIASCGGSSDASLAKHPAAAAQPAAADDSKGGSRSTDTAARADASEAHGKIPDRCGEGQSEGICAPPKPFVQSLCGSYPKPDIALILFAKSSPFTRVYLNRNMEAWYTSGQQSTSAKLLFDEEVIVLSHPKASSGGMVIGTGATNYDVLRLDGVCSSVEPEAITTKRPPAPKYASVPWQQLEPNVREALLQDPNIEKADAARRKECKGTTSLGMLSPACAKADDKLSTAVAAYVTRSEPLPMPKVAR
jgi:hypothetical protein